MQEICNLFSYTTNFGVYDLTLQFSILEVPIFVILTEIFQGYSHFLGGQAVE
jgi:hypothetical protein